MREPGSLPSSRARRGPSSAEVGRDRIGEADGRRNQVGKVSGLEIVEQATRLANQLVDEDALVGGPIRRQLVEPLGQLDPRPPEVARLELEQPRGFLVQTLVVFSLFIVVRSP